MKSVGATRELILFIIAAGKCLFASSVKLAYTSNELCICMNLVDTPIIFLFLVGVLSFRAIASDPPN